MMLDGAALAQFLLTGLTTGCAYALVALAIVLMFNVSGVVNLAQGEYGALGGLLLASMSAMHLPLPGEPRGGHRGRAVARRSPGAADDTPNPVGPAVRPDYRDARGRCCHPRRRVPDLGQGSTQRSRFQR